MTKAAAFIQYPVMEWIFGEGSRKVNFPEILTFSDNCQQMEKTPPSRAMIQKAAHWCSYGAFIKIIFCLWNTQKKPSRSRGWRWYRYREIGAWKQLDDHDHGRNELEENGKNVRVKCWVWEGHWVNTMSVTWSNCATQPSDSLLHLLFVYQTQSRLKCLIFSEISGVICSLQVFTSSQTGAERRDCHVVQSGLCYVA